MHGVESIVIQVVLSALCDDISFNLQVINYLGVNLSYNRAITVLLPCPQRNQNPHRERSLTNLGGKGTRR